MQFNPQLSHPDLPRQQLQQQQQQQQQQQKVELAAHTPAREQVVNTMFRSTIYQKHQERRNRTILLKDDPRPAPIRILSGLPGFRTFILPYQPQSKFETKSNNCNKLNNIISQNGDSHKNGAMFEDTTIFSTTMLTSPPTAPLGNNTKFEKAPSNINTFYPTTMSLFAITSGCTLACYTAMVLVGKINPVKQPMQLITSGRLATAAAPSSSLFMFAPIMFHSAQPHVAASSSMGVASVTPISIPLFINHTNSATVAFLRSKATPHRNNSLRSSLFFLRYNGAPAARLFFISSFLAFVGYRNIEHYNQLKLEANTRRPAISTD